MSLDRFPIKWSIYSGCIQELATLALFICCRGPVDLRYPCHKLLNIDILVHNVHMQLYTCNRHTDYWYRNTTRIFDQIHAYSWYDMILFLSKSYQSFVDRTGVLLGKCDCARRVLCILRCWRNGRMAYKVCFQNTKRYMVPKPQNLNMTWKQPWR